MARNEKRFDHGNTMGSLPTRGKIGVSGGRENTHPMHKKKKRIPPEICSHDIQRKKDSRSAVKGRKITPATEKRGKERGVEWGASNQKPRGGKTKEKKLHKGGRFKTKDSQEEKNDIGSGGKGKKSGEKNQRSSGGIQGGKKESEKKKKLKKSTRLPKRGETEKKQDFTASKRGQSRISEKKQKVEGKKEEVGKRTAKEKKSRGRKK